MYLRLCSDISDYASTLLIAGASMIIITTEIKIGNTLFTFIMEMNMTFLYDHAPSLK